MIQPTRAIDNNASAPVATYPDSVTIPPRPDSAPENHPGAQPRNSSWWSRLWHNLGRDAILVAPGMIISLFAFPILISLFAISIATIPIWIGILLLPLTLIIASGFADLSRARARGWGATIAEVTHRPRRPGISGWIRICMDGRRWVDLLFEMIFALPVRIVTFVVSLTWFAGALGGITYFFWGQFVPEDGPSLAELIVSGLTNSPATHFSFGVNATVEFVAGLLFLLTFPFVLHGMALLEIATTKAGLVPLESGSNPVSSANGNPASASAGSNGPGNTTEWRFPHFLVGRTPGWYWLISIFVGAVLVAVGWPVLGAAYGLGAAIAMVVSIAQSAAIAVSVRWPIAGIALGLVASIATIVASGQTSGMPWPWAVTSMLALLAVQVVLGLRHDWRYVTALWVLSAAISVGALFSPRDWSNGFVLDATWRGQFDGAFANSVTFMSLLTGISIIALLLRLSIRNQGELETERKLTAEELTKRQNLEERNRIAQELHDVVAHSMSVISVQATTARYRIPDLDVRSSEEFDSIAGSARQALTEMRGLLSILRGGREADLAPQPEFADIPTLVSATQNSSAEVALDFPSNVGPDSVAPTTGLTAFRVVQEGLSNALRHAPGALVHVNVAFAGNHLHIGVINGAATRAHTTTSTGGSGFGLRGMRERVEALGGNLQVGPTADGGFAVEASLPLG